MSRLDRDDIRAAVGAGLISEAQAASLIALSDTRQGVRERMTGLDEPFELFRGFNEVFIVVGLVILFTGYFGVTGVGIFGNEQGYLVAGGTAVLAMTAVFFLARYFTLTRRMVAPSILLALIFGQGAAQLGLAVSWWLDGDAPTNLTIGAGMATLALGLYYWWFRVPITVALIALGVFATSFGAVTMGGTFPSDWQDIFLLSADGPFAVMTFALGVVGFAIAMWFDMGDPHRITRRATSGFWLHVIAAPAIVNTVALTLFSSGSAISQIVLVLFIAAMALIAVVIDRRSFLVSGVGYIVALAITVMEGEGFWAILALGAGLVLLGAQWERLRGWLMATLPGFPGKNRLPPWTEVRGGRPA